MSVGRPFPFSFLLSLHPHGYEPPANMSTRPAAMGRVNKSGSVGTDAAGRQSNRGLAESNMCDTCWRIWRRRRGKVTRWPPRLATGASGHARKGGEHAGEANKAQGRQTRVGGRACPPWPLRRQETTRRRPRDNTGAKGSRAE
jgi:hypothetical protein